MRTGGHFRRHPLVAGVGEFAQIGNETAMDSGAPGAPPGASRAQRPRASPRRLDLDVPGEQYVAVRQCHVPIDQLQSVGDAIEAEIPHSLDARADNDRRDGHD